MDLSKRDADAVWHPYTQAQIEGLPIAVREASGSVITAEDGKTYIDAISSWWVNLHGHSHPQIVKRLKEQAEKLDQVIFAGFTHEPAIELAERLLNLCACNAGKVFYSDDGSTAVEAALKIALQYWYNQSKKRKTIIALEGAYHGDTFGAMSLSARGVFREPYEDYVFEVKYVPRPENAESKSLEKLKQIIAENDCAAFIFEPLIQGASGMKMYSAEGLDQLIKICKDNDIICIADEVFTGFGRTGKLLACDHLKQKPDIYVFSKGLSGGVLPLGATVVPDYIFDKFLSESRQKMFLHGHSYSGNPLACAAGNASFELLLSRESAEKIKHINKRHGGFLEQLSSHTVVLNKRLLGTILAFEVQTSESNYLTPLRDKLYNFYIENGVLLRPLGNTVYIVPPYCISDEELDKIYDVIEKSLELVK